MKEVKRKFSKEGKFLELNKKRIGKKYKKEKKKKKKKKIKYLKMMKMKKMHIEN